MRHNHILACRERLVHNLAVFTEDLLLFFVEILLVRPQTATFERGSAHRKLKGGVLQTCSNAVSTIELSKAPIKL
jgi:hypothetical protein